MPVKRKLENAVEEELVRRVHAAGGIAEKVTTLGNRGFFDRLVVLPPDTTTDMARIVFVEVKRPKGGIVSAHQLARIQRYRTLGAEVMLIRNSADIDWLLTVK